MTRTIRGRSDVHPDHEMMNTGVVDTESEVYEFFNVASRTYHVHITGTDGTRAATVKFYVSNDEDHLMDPTAWMEAAVVEVDITTPADGFSTSAKYAYVKCIITSITGSDTLVQVHMGV